MPGKEAIGGEVAPAKEESKRQEELRRVFGEPAERDRALANAAFTETHKKWQNLSDKVKQKLIIEFSFTPQEIELLDGDISKGITPAQQEFGRRIFTSSNDVFKSRVTDEALRQAEFGGRAVDQPSRPAPKSDKYTRWYTKVKQDYKFGALDDSDLKKIFNRTAGADFADFTIGEIEGVIGRLNAEQQKTPGVIKSAINQHLISKKVKPIFKAP
jgi:hypothetical protein